jgi:hypothetical protein
MPHHRILGLLTAFFVLVISSAILLDMLEETRGYGSSI